MVDKSDCLRIIKDNISLKEIFKDDFLKKIDENFPDHSIIPIGVAFAVKDDEITTDTINIAYRNDEELNNNKCIIDIQNDPENMNKIMRTFD